MICRPRPRLGRLCLAPALRTDDSVSLCAGVDQQVQKSPVFRREGADVHSDLLISVAQAILGGSARSQGLYETLNLPVRKPACAHKRKHSQLSLWKS